MLFRPSRTFGLRQDIGIGLLPRNIQTFGWQRARVRAKASQKRQESNWAEHQTTLFCSATPIYFRPRRARTSCWLHAPEPCPARILYVFRGPPLLWDNLRFAQGRPLGEDTRSAEATRSRRPKDPLCATVETERRSKEKDLAGMCNGTRSEITHTVSI